MPRTVMPGRSSGSVVGVDGKESFAAGVAVPQGSDITTFTATTCDTSLTNSWTAKYEVQS